MLDADSFPALAGALRRLREALADPNVKPGDDWQEQVNPHPSYIVNIRIGTVLRLLAGEGGWAAMPEYHPGVPPGTQAKLNELRAALLGGVPHLGNPCWGAYDRPGVLVVLDGALAVLRGECTDGPEPPHTFRWRGRACQDLSNGQFRLLDNLWDEGGCLRHVPFEDLRRAVWGADIGDSSIRSAISRLDAKLNRAGIYLGLGAGGHVVSCPWQ
jgi:hypothetical protein